MGLSTADSKQVLFHMILFKVLSLGLLQSLWSHRVCFTKRFAHNTTIEQLFEKQWNAKNWLKWQFWFWVVLKSCDVMENVIFLLENGATTLSITTFSIMTLSTKGLGVAFSITVLSITTLCHSAEWPYAECNVFFVLLSVIMLNVMMLCVIMLSVIMLSVMMRSVVILSVVMLSCHYAECRVFLVMLNVVMLIVIMLSVFLLSVIILNVVAPWKSIHQKLEFCLITTAHFWRHDSDDSDAKDDSDAVANLLNYTYWNVPT